MTIPQGYAVARRHPARSAALLLFALMLAVTAIFVSRHDTNAVPSPTTFELDGNTHSPGAVEDWVDVFNGADTADTGVFIPDFNFPAGTQPDGDDQPETGATKDPNDMDQWDCKAAGLSPPKNDIANAFVASYTVGGSQFIYFGLDRINSDNGTANVGFWFTKDNHSCDLDTGEWNDQKHSVGDTLVVSEFTAGGRVSTINVFVWCSDPAAPNLTCGSSTTLPPVQQTDGPLQLIFSGADCLDDAGNPINTPNANLACATVNRTILTDGPEWPYQGAGSKQAGCPQAAQLPKNTCKNYERGALFEGGINATGLGLDLRCIGTFIADTRSAASTTAQLHDFAVGQTDLCQATVSTQASTNSLTVLPGTSVSDTATVSGGTGQPTATGTVKFFLCQPSEVTAAGCPAGAGTQIGTPLAGETLNASGVAQSETTNNTNAIGKYCWRAEYSGDSNYPSPDPDHIHTNATTECFRTFNPGTVLSIADRIVNLPSDATGTVTYAVFSDSNCTTPVTTGTPSDGVITPANNNVGANGVAPLSILYTPAAPGTFYIRATFTGTGTYAGVNFSACNENAVLTF